MLGPIFIRMRGQIDDDRIEVLVLLANLAGRAFFDAAVDEGFGHAMAAREATGSAVAVRQELFHLGDAGVFFDMEEFLSQDEKNPEDGAKTREDKKSP